MKIFVNAVSSCDVNTIALLESDQELTLKEAIEKVKTEGYRVMTNEEGGDNKITNLLDYNDAHISVWPDSLIADIDFEAMAQDSKSHSAKELEEAALDGESIWQFNSGTSGNDDVLIFDQETSKEAIMIDLEAFFETDQFIEGNQTSPFEQDQPNSWSLEKLDLKEMAARWPKED